MDKLKLKQDAPITVVEPLIPSAPQRGVVLLKMRVIKVVHRRRPRPHVLVRCRRDENWWERHDIDAAAEGLRWCRGWEGPAVQALKVAATLRDS